MKKYLLVFAILTSMFSVVNISQANANCSESDPCGTWAVIDTQGIVTNVISCQASVCGSGNFAGQTVVPQVAPNPVTNDTYGTGSYIGNTEQGTQVRYENNGTFIIEEQSVINKSQTEINNNTVVVSEVSIPVSSKSFTYEDTIGKKFGEVEMTAITFNENLPTTLTVKENNLINTVRESVNIYERKTSSEIEQVFVNNNLNLLLSKVQTLISLLGSWVK